MKQIGVILLMMLCTGAAYGQNVKNLGAPANIDALQDSLTDVHGSVKTSEANTASDVAAVQVIVDELEGDNHASTFHFARKAVQTATSKADSSAGVFYPFVLTAAADSTYGTAVQILGEDDTPHVSGNTIFHLSGVMITAVNNNTPYKLRIVWGASVAAGLAANDLTEIWIFGDSANPQNAQPTAIKVFMDEVAAGTKVWVQIANAAGAQTLDMVFDIQEHD